MPRIDAHTRAAGMAATAATSHHDIRYHRVVLDNGIRIVSEQIPFVRSACIGIWVEVGSRDEMKGEAGISHLIEHMFFKGTKNRSAEAISREVDRMGGELNAFTSRETTTFYMKVLDNDLERAVELLMDLFAHSTFASRELEKEKQVILEEIRTVKDDPEDYVHDLHTHNVLKRHPLGRPILGNAASIQAFTRTALLNYRERHYHPRNIVIAVAGRFDQTRLIAKLSRVFQPHTATAPLPNGRVQPTIHSGVAVRTKRLAQTHLCLGLKGLPRDHRSRYVLAVLNSILGGSVSSRLFQEIREKRGLVYSIYSSTSSFEDAGMLTVYAATRANETLRVLELILKELRKLRTNLVDPKELHRAKCQLQGTMVLSLEESSSRMSKLAKDELCSGRYVSLKEMVAEINRVTGHQIWALSQELLDTQFRAITALGPLSREDLDGVV